MSDRSRIVVFVALFAVCALGAGLYVARAISRSRSIAIVPPGPVSTSTASADAQGAPDAGPRGPRVYFSSMSRGEAYGHLESVDLDDPAGARITAPLVCTRIHVAGGHGICLVDNRANIHPPTMVLLFDTAIQNVRTLPMAGAPSRARVSPDGRYGAATVFAIGDSYTTGFSTRTILIDMTSGESLGDLEQFTVERDGTVIRGADFNFWGVTFARENGRFYATLATGGAYYLIEGRVAERRVRVVREGVECPSLAPDGSRIAFKKKVGEGQWRLHVLDLATLRDRPIAAESRSIDDQVEWLDDRRVLYGIIGERGRPDEAVHIWVSDVETAEAPRIFVSAALSPAVVRE